MNQRSKWFGIVVILSMAGLLLAGCGDDAESSDTTATTAAGSGTTETSGSSEDAAWQEIVTAANEEGEVVLYYSKAEESVLPLIEGFEKAFPDITVSAVRLTTSDQIPRLDQELGQGQLMADVAWNTETGWQRENASKGTFWEPDGPSTEAWEADNYVDGVVRANIDPLVLTYNTNLVTEAPTDWDSLLDQKDLRVAVVEPAATIEIAFYDMLEKVMGADFLDRLAALDPSVTNGAGVRPSVTAGEVAWAPYGAASADENSIAQGAPLDYVIPESGTVAFEQNAVAFNDAPHPNAAKVFLDYMMSVEGQQLINGERRGLSTIDGVEGDIDADMEAISFVDQSQYPPEKVAEIRDRFASLFQ